MRLESIEYSECQGSPQEWSLEELRLGAINLIVGKNATGKSRVLNIINTLALQLAGLRGVPHSGHYEVVFIDQGKTLLYEVRFDEGLVVLEKFSLEGKLVLDRRSDGTGLILAEEIAGGTDIRFQTPRNMLAAVARRDAIQHKFLEPLHIWGCSVRHYCFGSPLGKDTFAIHLPNGGMSFDDRDPTQVVGVFRRAASEFGIEFKDKVLADMRRLNYDLEELGIKPPLSIRVSGLQGEVVGLFVKEKDFPGVTEHQSMSQGMFRALSLLIQLNYAYMSRKAACILIDDIGEGLDFQRSCQLIDLLRHKAQESGVQVVLSTNDRFVMNGVPLEEWSVLRRHGSRVQVRNVGNSRHEFEEFKFTGLSNFSFLEMDFISGPMQVKDAAHA